MATKSAPTHLLPPNHSVADKNCQYTNLNLNQSCKYLDVVLPVYSLNKSFNKISDHTVTDFSLNKKSWTTKDFCLKTLKELSLTAKDERRNQKRWMKHVTSSENLNSSTLSLHIAAYENSIEVSNESEDSLKNTDSINGLPQFTTDKDCFEFPRQMEGYQQTTPEVQQFVASQRLFSPNESNDEVENPAKNWW